MANTINLYHDNVDDFNSNFSMNNQNFICIAQWNVRGLNNMQKFDDILLFLDNLHVPIDILILGET